MGGGREASERKLSYGKGKVAHEPPTFGSAEVQRAIATTQPIE